MTVVLTRLRKARHRCGGQSIIESCIIICLTALIFAGLLQVSQLVAAREILFHSAACGARAKTVGLNWWMVEKSIRVAAIPNAGLITEPTDVDNSDPVLAAILASPSSHQHEAWDYALNTVPGSPQLAIELSRIPEYLASANNVRAEYLLNYDEWDTVNGDHETMIPGDGSLPRPSTQVHVRQHYPLRIPGHRAFYAADNVHLDGESEIESHYPLYIEDMGW